MKPGEKILLATGNPGKIREIRELLATAGVQVLGADEAGWDPDVVEDGDTLEANARIKARAGLAATGLTTIADDSGLFVDTLDGAPGVHSARFAGESQDSRLNCAKLLGSLEGVAPDGRGAEFRCVILLATAAGEEQAFTGVCRGRIALAARGTDGFGYDPIFEIPGTGRTFAEMSFEEKNRISHRGKALRLLTGFVNRKMSEGVE